MATPTLSRHVLPGSLGDVLVDVRSATRTAAQPAVVIVHGFKGFKDWGFFPPLAQRLARAGFTAVSYNVSGSGVDAEGRFTLPDRFARNTFSAELDDLGVVLDALDDGRLDLVRPSRIGVVGHSRGGGIAILMTPDRPRLEVLVTWAAISSVHRWTDEMKRLWRERGALEVRNQRTGEVLPLQTDILDDIEGNAGRLDVLGAAARVSVPWLLLHGAVDETVKVEEGRALAGAAGHASLVEVPQGSHTFGAAHPFAGTTPALDLVLDATVGFLTRHLP